MKAGIMQPYFWPYLGYFQLISAVDCFVLYDNIQYTKKGWFNRNRYLCNGQDKYFTIPLAKASDFLDVRDRVVADSFDRKKLKNQIRMSYSHAPFFETVFPMFCECIDYQNKNLFEYIYYSVEKILDYLQINTKLIVASTLGIGHEYKGKDKVLAICKKLQADSYINAVGGQRLYNKKEFHDEGIKLFFIEMDSMAYHQFDNVFVDKLSILDVLMFNPKEKVIEMLQQYTLL